MNYNAIILMKLVMKRFGWRSDVEISMKRMAVIIALVTVGLVVLSSTAGLAAMFTFGCYRDGQCINRLYDRFYGAPCHFPPADNPCAVPCRPPGFQEQAVPCAFKTACPSEQLPCHGVEYGAFPYPLFRVK